MYTGVQNTAHALAHSSALQQSDTSPAASTRRSRGDDLANARSKRTRTAQDQINGTHDLMNDSHNALAYQDPLAAMSGGANPSDLLYSVVSELHNLTTKYEEQSQLVRSLLTLQQNADRQQKMTEKKLDKALKILEDLKQPEFVVTLRAPTGPQGLASAAAAARLRQSTAGSSGMAMDTSPVLPQAVNDDIRAIMQRMAAGAAPNFVQQQQQQQQPRQGESSRSHQHQNLLTTALPPQQQQPQNATPIPAPAPAPQSQTQALSQQTTGASTMQEFFIDKGINNINEFWEAYKIGGGGLLSIQEQLQRGLCKSNAQKKCWQRRKSIIDHIHKRAADMQTTAEDIANRLEVYRAERSMSIVKLAKAISDGIATV